MTKYVVFLIYSHLDKGWRLPHLQLSWAESCVSIMELLHFPLQHSSCLSPGSSCTAVIMRTSSIFPCSSRHYYIRHDSWQLSSFKKIGSLPHLLSSWWSLESSSFGSSVQTLEKSSTKSLMYSHPDSLVSSSTAVEITNPCISSTVITKSCVFLIYSHHDKVLRLPHLQKSRLIYHLPHLKS